MGRHTSQRDGPKEIGSVAQISRELPLLVSSRLLARVKHRVFVVVRIVVISRLLSFQSLLLRKLRLQSALLLWRRNGCWCGFLFLLLG